MPERLILGEELPPYDFERHGSLGEAGREEVIDILSTEGKLTRRGFASGTWRGLIILSSSIAREQGRLRAESINRASYIRRRAIDEKIRTRQLEEGETVEDLLAEISRLEAQIDRRYESHYIRAGNTPLGPSHGEGRRQLMQGILVARIRDRCP